jgi:hypothetical protein
MLKHVVLFRFADPTPANLDRATAALRGLLGAVPSLRAIEVGADVTRSERSYDLCLITDFDDRAGLAAYATHPSHLEVVAVLRELTTGSVVVDYEV